MNLYDKHYAHPGDGRDGLFRLINDRFHPTKGLYPGSFVHVTPSFYVPTMTYVDSDKRTSHFFRDGAADRIVGEHRVYGGRPTIRFYPMDYTAPLPIREGSVDLLISQFAGIVSEPCARYLCSGGLLLVNDSHGDAGIANADPCFELIAVIDQSNEDYRIRMDGLGRYFIRDLPAPMPERSDLVSYLKGIGRGLTYSRGADHYLFRKR